jgi:hypothetical protein
LVQHKQIGESEAESSLVHRPAAHRAAVIHTGREAGPTTRRSLGRPPNSVPTVLAYTGRTALDAVYNDFAKVGKENINATSRSTEHYPHRTFRMDEV